MKHSITCFKTLAIMLLLLCTVLPAMAEPAAVEKPASKAVMQGTVNINTADATQLTLLPGIGPKSGRQYYQPIAAAPEPLPRLMTL